MPTIRNADRNALQMHATAAIIARMLTQQNEIDHEQRLLAELNARHERFKTYLACAVPFVYIAVICWPLLVR